ncbi:MAG: alpha/beta hydrolase [Polyangia bacterium]
MIQEPVAARLPLSTGLCCELLEWLPDDPSCDHTVLLLHGYLDLAWGWKPVVDAGLCGKYHLLAPSFRGHGASDWVGAGSMYYFLDYVADLASLVSQRARKRLSIVGHSMGGMVSAYFTGTYPELVEKLVLLEGLVVEERPTSPERLRTSNGMRADAVKRRGTQAQPGSRRFASLDEAAVRMKHHDPELEPALARLLAEKGCIQLPTGEWVFRHDPLLGPSTPIGFEEVVAQRFWRKITCDVLYVEGDRSSFKLPAEVRSTRLGAFHHIRTKAMSGASHMMIRHQPDAVCTLLVDFLENRS